jgi:hypothetical protein
MWTSIVESLMPQRFPTVGHELDRRAILCVRPNGSRTPRRPREGNGRARRVGLSWVTLPRGSTKQAGRPAERPPGTRVAPAG